MTLKANPPRAPYADQGADRYLNSNEALLRYRDEGSGPSILLVHGWTLDLEMWEPQVDFFRKRFRIIRYDRRGFGLSSGRPSLQGDVEDMEALCRHLGIERVAVLGMSQGARPALGFAVGAPQLLSCLILDGPPDCVDPPGRTEDDFPLDHYRELIRTRGLEVFRRQWREHPLVKLRTGDKRQRELVGAMIDRYPAHDLLERALAIAPTLSPEQLDLVRTPVLVVTGEHEEFSRVASANVLTSRLPDAERAVISEAGHLANLDNPCHYNAVIGAFLERYAAEH